MRHIAAGVIFAASAIELLPELLKHSPAPTLIGFALGIATMFALRYVTDRVERAGRGGAGLIAATGVDFLVDGAQTSDPCGEGWMCVEQQARLLEQQVLCPLCLASAVSDDPGPCHQAQGVGQGEGVAISSSWQ